MKIIALLKFVEIGAGLKGVLIKVEIHEIQSVRRIVEVSQLLFTGNNVGSFVNISFDFIRYILLPIAGKWQFVFPIHFIVGVAKCILSEQAYR